MQDFFTQLEEKQDQRHFSFNCLNKIHYLIICTTFTTVISFLIVLYVSMDLTVYVI